MTCCCAHLSSTIILTIFFVCKDLTQKIEINMQDSIEKKTAEVLVLYTGGTIGMTINDQGGLYFQRTLTHYHWFSYIDIWMEILQNVLYKLLCKYFIDYKSRVDLNSFESYSELFVKLCCKIVRRYIYHRWFVILSFTAYHRAYQPYDW